MNNHTFMALGLVVAIALAGCSSTSPKWGDDAITYHYKCESGEMFTVVYARDFAKAWLELSEREYALKRIGQGPGGHFVLADDPPDTHHPLTLLTKVDQARLEFKGTVFKNCRIVN